MITLVIGKQKIGANKGSFTPQLHNTITAPVYICGWQVLKLRGEVQYRKTLITNNGSPTGAGSPVGIAVDPARG